MRELARFLVEGILRNDETPVAVDLPPEEQLLVALASGLAGGAARDPLSLGAVSDRQDIELSNRMESRTSGPEIVTEVTWAVTECSPILSQSSDRLPMCLCMPSSSGKRSHAGVRSWKD